MYMQKNEKYLTKYYDNTSYTFKEVINFFLFATRKFKHF